MFVRDGMNAIVVTVRPAHTLREAARRMHDRSVGAAVVFGDDQPAPGIITERDLLGAAGRGEDLDANTSTITCRRGWSTPRRTGRSSARPSR